MTRWMSIGIALALTFPSFAQQPTKVEESVQVTLVEVPVNVIDRNGNPVRGLTAANFELIDEGKKRPIAYFESLDLASETAPAAPTPMNPAARRHFLLLFDLSSSSPGNIVRAREAAQEFIQKELSPRDLVGVATFSVENGFRLLATFTTDRNLVRIAIDTLGNPKFFKSVDPLFLSASTFDNLPTTNEPDRAPDGSRPRDDAQDAIVEMVGEMNRMSQQGDEEFRRGRIRRQLRNFAAFARVLDSIQGRKQVILLSEGFDARLVQGREMAGEGSTMQQESDAVLSGEVWRVDSDKRYGNTATANELGEMANVFRRSDVVLHAIDIKGLRSDVDAREGRRASSNESLFLMSKPTGGEFFKNANDLTTNFQKMIRQQDVVYVLGFQAPSTGNLGKFHNLKVKLVNVPSGSRVSHRAGYYEPSDKINPLEETLSASAVLLNDIPQDEVPFRMIAAAFPADNANPRVPVIIEIPGNKLLESVTGTSLSGEIFVYAFDRAGAVKDFLHQRVSLDLTKVGESLKKGGIKYYGMLSLAPGNYAVKVLVRVAESRRSGFQRVDLSVPRFSDPVVLQPFVFEPDVKWVMVKGRPRSVAEVDYPFEVAKESFVPEAEPRLKVGESRKVALFTYNLTEAIELDAKIRGAGGEKKANVSVLGKTSRDAQGATKLVLSFTPNDLAPGAYWLEVAVRGKGGAAQMASTKFMIE